MESATADSEGIAATPDKILTPKTISPLNLLRF